MASRNDRRVSVTLTTEADRQSIDEAAEQLERGMESARSEIEAEPVSIQVDSAELERAVDTMKSGAYELFDTLGDTGDRLNQGATLLNDWNVISDETRESWVRIGDTISFTGDALKTVIIWMDAIKAAQAAITAWKERELIVSQGISAEAAKQAVVGRGAVGGAAGGGGGGLVGAMGGTGGLISKLAISAGVVYLGGQVAGGLAETTYARDFAHEFATAEADPSPGNISDYMQRQYGFSEAELRQAALEAAGSERVQSMPTDSPWATLLGQETPNDDRRRNAAIEETVARLIIRLEQEGRTEDAARLAEFLAVNIQALEAETQESNAILGDIRQELQRQTAGQRDQSQSTGSAARAAMYGGGYGR